MKKKVVFGFEVKKPLKKKVERQPKVSGQNFSGDCSPTCSVDDSNGERWYPFIPQRRHRRWFRSPFPVTTMAFGRFFSPSSFTDAAPTPSSSPATVKATAPEVQDSLFSGDGFEALVSGCWV